MSTPPSVSPATLPDLGPGTDAPGDATLERLADVDLEVRVELGRANLRMRDLLRLNEGSVVELDRSPDTPVDVYVNGQMIAHAEVVVVGDELGVRITELLDR